LMRCGLLSAARLAQACTEHGQCESWSALAFQEMTRRWTDGIAVGVHQLSAEICRVDASVQRASGVRRDRMPLMQRLRVHLERFVGVEEREVGLVSRRQTSLVAMQPDETRRPFAHPAQRMLERKRARARLAPNGRERQFERRYATPRREKVSALALLHRRRTGRMVRDDEIENAFLQRAPERLAIAVATDRRRTLEFRRARGNLLRVEREIMRARLGGDRDAIGLRLAQQRDHVA